MGQQPCAGDRAHALELPRAREAGDTREQPGEQVVAFNAIAEHLDYGRRYSPHRNQVRRFFEDTWFKHRALELVAAV